MDSGAPVARGAQRGAPSRDPARRGRGEGVQSRAGRGRLGRGAARAMLLRVARPSCQQQAAARRQSQASALRARARAAGAASPAAAAGGASARPGDEFFTAADSRPVVLFDGTDGKEARVGLPPLFTLPPCLDGLGPTLGLWLRSGKSILCWGR